MEYIRLGNSSLNVSRICLGCMGFGDANNGQHSWTLDKEHSREIIRYALSQGINFFDTALGYQNGTSEQYVGSAIRDFAKREDVVVATKFLPRSKEEIEQRISMREHIINSLNQSLKNLGMDYIDLYIYHIWDYNAKLEEVMETLNDLVVSKKVRYIGISNCFAYQLAKANDIADRNGWAKFVSIQGHYNLIFREEEREMARLCGEDNIAMTPYSSLASGRLAMKKGETSKRLTEDTYAKFKYDATQEEDRKIIDRVEELANKHNVSMSEVALSWLREKTTAPIVGATEKKHIDTAIKSISLKLSESEMRYLEELYIPHKLVGVMSQNNK